MSKYLLKWKEKYRCRMPYDLATGEYVRNNDELASDDIYIECQKGDQIYDIDSSKKLLVGYFSNKRRGKNIIAEIEKLHPGIIWDIQESDSEIWFTFNGNKSIHIIAELMKARKPMSNTSPYSTKYLPSHKKKLDDRKAAQEKYEVYETPKGYWTEMREILPILAKQHKKNLNYVLNLLYEEFGDSKRLDLLADAEENNYKINHWVLKSGLWEEFVQDSKNKLHSDFIK